MGRPLADSITSRDYSLAQGFTVIIAFGFALLNLAVDVLYGWLDTRASIAVSQEPDSNRPQVSSSLSVARSAAASSSALLR